MYRIKDLWIWDVLREMKKRWWIKSFVLLFVFLSSSLAIAFIAALYAVKMTGKGTMAAYHPDMVKEGRAQLGFNLRDLAVNLPGAFFIYRADDGKILFANMELLRITECSSMEVFIEFIGRKVKGLIAPEDYAEAVESCDQQVGDSDDAVAHMDYHVITKETHKRIYVHAVAHMVKNPYFGEIYYVILSPKPEQK